MEYQHISKSIPSVSHLNTYLSQHVIHSLTRFRIPLPQQPQKLQYPDLQERVGDTVDIVLGGVAGRDEGFEVFDEEGDGLTRRSSCQLFGLEPIRGKIHLTVVVTNAVVDTAHLRHKRHSRQQHSMVPVL